MSSALRLLRQDKGMTHDEAAAAMGISRGQYIKLERGERKLTERTIGLAAKAFGVSKGAIVEDTPTVRPSRELLSSLVSSFDPDAPDEEEAPEDSESAEAARRFARRQLGPGELVERDARGGLGLGGGSSIINVDGSTVDNVKATWRVPQDFLHTELRAREADVDIIAVDGDSMVPTLLPGDRVLVHRASRSPSPDGLFAIDDGIGTSVKRLQLVRGSDPLQVRIISDNATHKEDIVSASDLQVIGRVICKVTRL